MVEATKSRLGGEDADIKISEDQLMVDKSFEVTVKGNDIS